MSQSPIFDPVEYLVSKRYPDLHQYKPPLAHPGDGVWRAAQIYRKMLQSMPASDFEEYLALELQGPTARDPSIPQPDAADPSDLQLADDDFDFWACMPVWTLEEAIALSLGLAPEKVRWWRAQKFPNITEVDRNYTRRQEIMTRHQRCQRLSNPTAPGHLVAWAKRLNVKIPDKLAEAVESHGNEIVDWKDRFETQKALHRKHNARWREVSKELRHHRERAFENVAKFRAELSSRDDEISALRDRCRFMEKQAERREPPKPQQDKPINTKEKESLLKITIGLAVKGYRFDPSASRNSSVKEMHDDITSLGLTISDDTIRKFLREGAELLPPYHQG